MRKVVSILLGGFLLANSINAFELTDKQRVEINSLANRYEEIKMQTNLEQELERALNYAISDSKRIKNIADSFNSKKEFLEASKRILKKWENEINRDLEKIIKEEKQ